MAPESAGPRHDACIFRSDSPRERAVSALTAASAFESNARVSTRNGVIAFGVGRARRSRGPHVDSAARDRNPLHPRRAGRMVRAAGGEDWRAGRRRDDHARGPRWSGRAAASSRRIPPGLAPADPRVPARALRREILRRGQVDLSLRRRPRPGLLGRHLVDPPWDDRGGAPRLTPKDPRRRLLGRLPARPFPAARLARIRDRALAQRGAPRPRAIRA